jgi:flagellar basal body-associated protein FliL
VFLANLPATGQSQTTLISILIIGAVLVVAGIAAMVAVRVSRKKNSSASTFKPTAEDTVAKPAAKKAAPKKPAAKKPASDKK